MTLIVAGVGVHYAVMVSDRAVSSADGKKRLWESTKTMVLASQNAVLTVGYTGVASQPREEGHDRRFITEPWLGHTLAAAAKVDPTWPNLGAHVQSAAERELLAPRQEGPLTMVFAGYTHEFPNGRDQAYVASSELSIITNSQMMDGSPKPAIYPGFVFEREVGSVKVGFWGMHDALPDGAEGAIDSMIDNPAFSPEQVVDTIVDYIRQAAAECAIGISDDCNSFIMYPARNKPGKAGYHHPGTPTVEYYPALVSADDPDDPNGPVVLVRPPMIARGKDGYKRFGATPWDAYYGTPSPYQGFRPPDDD